MTGPLQSGTTTNGTNAQFPHFASGKVVKGFGRGSKQLGVPTANYPNEVVDKLPESFEQGVYYGWAQIDNGPVYKMVMSIGYNPYYNNEKKTMETYVMHEFPEDFYGANLKTVILGYLRPMTSYKSLDDLIAAIHKDIDDARKALDLPPNQLYQSDHFFQQIPEVVISATLNFISAKNFRHPHDIVD